MMIIENAISEKGYYRFVEFVSKLCGYSLPHERYKLIALDHYEALSGEELAVKHLADAYLFALSNLNQPLNGELLNSIAFLLTGAIIGASSKGIIEQYYAHKDESPYFAVMKVHLSALQCLESRKTEFAFIVSNWVLLKRQHQQLVPYAIFWEAYSEAVAHGNESKLSYLFFQMEEPKNDISEKQIVPKGPRQISSLVCAKKEELKGLYHVDRLFLYGSVAKGIIRRGSDVDFVVAFENPSSPPEVKEWNESLRRYLNHLLACPVDLVDLTDALEKLELSEMENTLALI
jgi:predicted nucleotidyltransferase